jgi:hypothetical protein
VQRCQEQSRILAIADFSPIVVLLHRLGLIVQSMSLEPAVAGTTFRPSGARYTTSTDMTPQVPVCRRGAHRTGQP